MPNLDFNRADENPHGYVIKGKAGIFYHDADPTVAPGYDVPEQSVLLVRDGSASGIYEKTGAAVTDWTKVGSTAAQWQTDVFIIDGTLRTTPTLTLSQTPIANSEAVIWNQYELTPNSTPLNPPASPATTFDYSISVNQIILDSTFANPNPPDLVDGFKLQDGDVIKVRYQY